MKDKIFSTIEKQCLDLNIHLKEFQTDAEYIEKVKLQVFKIEKEKKHFHNFYYCEHDKH